MTGKNNLNDTKLKTDWPKWTFFDSVRANTKTPSSALFEPQHLGPNAEMVNGLFWRGHCILTEPGLDKWTERKVARSFPGPISSKSGARGSWPLELWPGMTLDFITWAPWHLKSSGTRLFVQQHILATINLVTIGSDKALMPVRRLVSSWANSVSLQIGPLWKLYKVESKYENFH